MADEGNGVLMENINHKLDAILEGQAAMASVPARLDRIEDRLATVEGDVKVIKAAVTDLGARIRGHESRISDLEQAAA